MGWKLFAVIFVLITVLGVVSPHSYSSPAEIIDTVMNVPASIGLVLMAFGISFLSRKVRRGFALAYTAYSVVYIEMLSRGLYKHYAVEGKAFSVVAGAFLLFGGLQFAVCVGLWLYALNRSQGASISRV